MIWCFWWMPKKPDIGRPTSNINPTLHLFAETGCSESTNFGRRDEDRGWESRTSWIVWKSWEGWHLTFDWVDTFWILWTVLLVQLDIAWGAAFNFRDQECATGNFFFFPPVDVLSSKIWNGFSSLKHSSSLHQMYWDQFNSHFCSTKQMCSRRPEVNIKKHRTLRWHVLSGGTLEAHRFHLQRF